MWRSFIHISLLVLSFVQPSHPQTFVRLFSDQIPEEYLKDENKLEQVEINLSYYAKVNPDLIYYYLNHLDLLVNQKKFNRDSNYYNILRYEVSKSNKLNNDWVNEKLVEIQNLKEPELVINKLESLTEDFEVSEISAPEYEIELFIDKNLQKFYAYKCLIKDIDLAYIETINYKNLLDDTIRKMISEISKVQNYRGADIYETRYNFYEKLLKYHIFSEGFSDGINKETNFDFVNFLISLIDYSEFREYYGLIFNIGGQQLSTSFPVEKFSEPYVPYHTFNIQNPENILVLYDVAAGYRVMFNEFKKPFSHMDFNLGYSFGNHKVKNKSNTQSIDKYYFIWEGEPNNFTFLFNGTIDSISWDINKFSSFSVKLNTPLYYYNQQLLLIIGIEYKILFWETTGKIYRHIIEQLSINNPESLAPEIETYRHKESKQIFGGSITLNYFINNFLFINGTLSSLPSIQLGLGYFLTL